MQRGVQGNEHSNLTLFPLSLWPSREPHGPTATETHPQGPWRSASLGREWGGGGRACSWGWGQKRAVEHRPAKRKVYSTARFNFNSLFPLCLLQTFNLFAFLWTQSTLDFSSLKWKCSHLRIFPFFTHVGMTISESYCFVYWVSFSFGNRESSFLLFSSGVSFTVSGLLTAFLGCICCVLHDLEQSGSDHGFVAALPGSHHSSASDRLTPLEPYCPHLRKSLWGIIEISI